MDLNLLFAFDALAAEENVTRAARRVGITQPAMSNALARLRDGLGDPLFVRCGRSVVPTPRARNLAPLVRRALGELERGLFPSSEFSLSKATGTITLALSEYWQFALLPELIPEMERDAPGVVLRVLPLAGDLPEALASGAIDAAIYLELPGGSGPFSQSLVSDSYACVVRRGHPTMKGRPSIEAFARCRHVRVLPDGPWSERLRRALEARGLHAQCSLETAHLQVALDVVSHTDCLAVIPRRVAVQARKRWPIRVLKMPIDVGRFGLSVYWHQRCVEDPLHGWFRGRLIDLAKKAYFAPARLSSGENHSVRHESRRQAAARRW